MNDDKTFSILKLTIKFEHLFMILIYLHVPEKQLKTGSCYDKPVCSCPCSPNQSWTGIQFLGSWPVFSQNEPPKGNVEVNLRRFQFSIRLGKWEGEKRRWRWIFQFGNSFSSYRSQRSHHFPVVGAKLRRNSHFKCLLLCAWK